jgi:hypothetical protein
MQAPSYGESSLSQTSLNRLEKSLSLTEIGLRRGLLTGERPNGPMTSYGELSARQPASCKGYRQALPRRTAKDNGKAGRSGSTGGGKGASSKLKRPRLR